MSASKGMSVFVHNGTEYNINDPNVANEFSTSAAYSVGDYFTYQGSLYRVIAAHSAGAFNSAEVEQVYVSQELKGLGTTLAKCFKSDGYITAENKQSKCGGDCNNIASGTFYGVDAGAGLDHAPVNNLMYSIATFGKYTDRTAGDLQIAAVTTTNRYYFRVYINSTSGWQGWNELASVASVKTLENLAFKSGNNTITTDNKQTICNGDCNDMPNNTFYGVATGTGLTNSPPTSGMYTIATFGKYTDRTAGDLQIAASAGGNRLFSRVYTNQEAGWKPWVEVDNTLCFRATETLISNSNKSAICNGDCDDIPNNTFYFVEANALDNQPISGYSYTIATLGKFIDRTAGDVQVAGINHFGKLYYRIFETISAGWSEWKAIQDAITDESIYSGVTMFERFGVIGDSFASGPSLNGPTDPLNHNFKLSWGQDMAREAGVECINYSVGGCGTWNFLNTADRDYNTHLNGKLLSDIAGDKKCGLYLLCLGINDSNANKTFGDKHGGLEYLGSSADIDPSDYTQNANSFWGNYGKIIAEIMELNPTARIVMSTYCRIDTGEPYAYDAYNEAIQEIAEYFGIPCIVLTQDSFFRSPFYLNHLVSNHPSSLQHVGYGRAVERLLSRCMVNNFDYFRVYKELPE